LKSSKAGVDFLSLSFPPVKNRFSVAGSFSKRIERKTEKETEPERGEREYG
jgi:hypothetical protein